MSPVIVTKSHRKVRRIAHRLLLSHILLAVLTASLVTWLAWEISCEAEDTVIKEYLLFVAEHVDGRQDADIGSLSPLIKVFEKPEALPPELSKAKNFEPGFHEMDRNMLDDRETHLLIWKRPSDGRRLYAVADMPEPRSAASIISLLVGVVLVITLAGVAIGFMLTRKALQPLLHLADIVCSSKGGELPPGFSDSFGNDEIGALARQMEAYVRQRERFVQRERQFLLDASHELRTPLTVLEGAIELMRVSPQYKNGTSERRLERMERSVFRMQHTLECLLWLAHEDNKALSISKEEFTQALDGLISEWKAVLPSEISFVVTVKQNCVLDEPLNLWIIAIRNLIENAAHHTDSGKIEVTVSSDQIKVSDTGCGISEEILSRITETWVHGPKTRGYGLGLSIVNRIAIRMGWSLKIKSKLGQGTIVTIERQKL
jgi:signal transduction histidine kinase